MNFTALAQIPELPLSHYQRIREGQREMKKTTVARNLSVKDAMSFDDLYDEISSNWQLKAENLQNRRWRAMRRNFN